MNIEAVLKKYEPLVHKLARNMVGKTECRSYLQYSDLVSIGQQAIIENLVNYDAKKASLMTFLFDTIRYGMFKALFETSTLKRGHINFVYRYHKIKRILGESSTDAEVIKYCEKHYSDVNTRITAKNIEAIKFYTSLKVINDTKSAMQVEADETDLIEEIEVKDKMELIRKASQKLKPQMRHIILARLQGIPAHGVRKDLGICKQRVHQLEKEAIQILSKELRLNQTNPQ